MTFSGWASYGGVEIINSQRANTYAKARGIQAIRCSPCPNLYAAVGDDEYVDPITDDAPWYDPGVPESGRFLGFVGLEISGLDKGTSTQTHTDLATGGAALGPAREEAREILIRGYAVAQDDAALSYGIAWLNTALKGSTCSGGCGGEEFCVFVACPAGNPVSPDFGDREARTLYQVGVIDAPAAPETSRRRLIGGVGAPISVTLLAGRPWIHSTPADVISTDLDDIYVGDIVVAPQDTSDCEEATDCLDNPFCPAPPAPPVLPIPVDPCFPTTSYVAERFVITIPDNIAPEWYQKVPVISLYTGDAYTRRVSIRFHTAYLGGSCEDPTNPCNACTQINLAYLPEGATFMLDGRTEAATVDCAGGSGQLTATPTLYGEGGSLFEWPVFECNASLCVEILIEQGSRSPLAQVGFQMVARQDAA